MRRLPLAAAVVLLALGCGNASATSGRIAARLVPPSGGILAGRTTTAAIKVTRGGRPLRGVVPRIRLASPGSTVSSTARTSTRPGTYSVRFRLPTAGAWTYRIDAVVTVHKSALADQADQLFNPDGPHKLVLVTCGGEYVGGKQGYEDNRVVTASLVSRP